MGTFDDVNDMVQIWNSLFLEVVDKHAPVKHHRVKEYRQPDWLSPEILDAIKDTNKCKVNGHVADYRYLRNKVSSMIE